VGLTYAIDFGTSNSLLAAARDGKALPPIALDPFAKDPTVLRTLLFFPTAKEVFYGAQAIQEFVKHDLEGRFIRSIKKYLPMRSFVGTFVENRPLHLENIIGVFLGEVRRRANAHFGEDVDSVILGRPARFATDDVDDQFAQRRLEKAAQLAGFKHIDFFEEPLAAAFDLRGRISKPLRVLVADFGGGTSDFTVMHLKPDAFHRDDVLGLGGISLAGDAYDGSLMRGFVAKHLGSRVRYKVPFGSNELTMPVQLMEKLCSPADFILLQKPEIIDFFKQVQSWSLGPEDRRIMTQLFTVIDDHLAFDLFERIEGAKRILSLGNDARITYEYPDVRIDEPLTTAQFGEASQSISDRILKSLDDTLAQAQLSADEIDVVYCTGGTAHIPFLRDPIAARFGTEKLQSQNFFHSIISGLARRAAEF